MRMLFALLHHTAVVTLVVCALLSIYQLRQPFTVGRAKLLRRADIVNGVAATLVLLAGSVRVFYLEKGSAFYFGNGPFLAKLGVYGLASVLSLVPTLEIRRWRVPLQQGQLPTMSKSRRTALHAVAWAQLACLAAMALCAYWALHCPAWRVLASAR